MYKRGYIIVRIQRITSILKARWNMQHDIINIHNITEQQYQWDDTIMFEWE